MTLLDTHMPECDRRARHASLVHAHASTVARCVEHADLGESAVLRTLLERCGDARLLGRVGRLDLDALRNLGCPVFRSPATCEIAVGALASFSEGAFILENVTVDAFAQTWPPGSAKLFVHFGVASAGVRRAILAIETRLRSADRTATTRILSHWDAVERLAAGARRDVLLAIKALAESGSSQRSRWD